MKKVLVVDDDQEVRDLIVMILSEQFEVSSASNGLEGLELARSLHPDLIVLDLLMPKMHGFEVCLNVRADADLKSTKILISSSKSYYYDVRTTVEETGADGYIVKPFSVNELKDKVTLMLSESR